MKGWPNPDLRRKLERQVASLAAAIIDERAPMVGSTQRMHKLLYQLGLRENVDPVVRTFNAIAAETNHLPLGTEREHWDADALREKDIEIAQKEAWARGIGLESCRELVTRYGPDKGAT